MSLNLISSTTTSTISVNTTSTTTATAILSHSTATNHYNLTTTTTAWPSIGNSNFTSPPWIYPFPTPVQQPDIIYNKPCCYWYGYYYYLIVLVFIVLAAVIAKLAIRRREEEIARGIRQQRTRARQCTQVNVISSGQSINNCNGGNDSNSALDADLPPKYDDVVRNYPNAKEQLAVAEEGAVGGSSAAASGGMTMTASTVTIETVLNTSASVNDLSTSTAVTTILQPPPAYGSALGCASCSTSNINNNHVA